MVLVLDRRKKPLMSCDGKRARLLLESGRARVHRLRPFTIRLIDMLLDESEIQRVKAPGARKSRKYRVAASRKVKQKNRVL
jgi:hypothetical protein